MERASLQRMLLLQNEPEDKRDAYDGQERREEHDGDREFGVLAEFFREDKIYHCGGERSVKQQISIESLNAEWGCRYVGRRKSPEDANHGTAQRVTPGLRTEVVQSVAEANQHQGNRRIAEEPERAEQGFGNLHPSYVEGQTKNACVD